jgi:hypothetical protein
LLYIVIQAINRIGLGQRPLGFLIARFVGSFESKK